MNNFLLKTQINDNPPQLWRLKEPFDIDSRPELKKNLNYLMQSHFVEFGPEPLRVECISPTGFLYVIGSQILLDGDKVNKCFTRKSIKADFSRTLLPPDWQGTLEEFNNFVLAIPDNRFNDFIAQNYLSIPAFDEPSSYRDTLKILRTTVEDPYPLSPGVQYIDAFDFLKEHLVNHVSELDNSGFSVAVLKDDAIVFTAEAIILTLDACIPQASQWSRPITWGMVNHPNSGDYIGVDLGKGIYGIHLDRVTNVHDFFEELKRQHNTENREFILETRTNTDGSVTVRYLPSITSGNIQSTCAPRQVGKFYTYSPENIGNSRESVINLADAFESPPLVGNCKYPRAPAES